MPSALSVAGSRVLTPTEADALRTVISKPSSKALFDLMLYTGLRFSEVRQLADNPAIFNEGRNRIEIASTKPKAKAKGPKRDVVLGDRARAAVRTFLDLGAKVPASVSAWQQNLIRWADAAGLAPLPTATTAGNPTGITARTTRKTWESWLLAACPAEITRITLSQGHSETVALRHYLSAAWTEDELEAIRLEVAGWRPRTAVH